MAVHETAGRAGSEINVVRRVPMNGGAHGNVRMSQIRELVEKIRSIANEYCESQMYCWPGFDPMDRNPKQYFRNLGIEFDGDLFIRYRVEKTFRPMSIQEILEEESKIGVLLPADYKSLLEEFGPVHLPGDANVAIDTPMEALRATRSAWCYEGKPLSAIAISAYNRNADGNSIGFIRKGSEFSSIVYEFDHELAYKGDDPLLWSRPLADTLSAFLLNYLDTK